METIIVESNRTSAYANEIEAEKEQVDGEVGTIPSSQHPNHEWSTTVERGISLREGDSVKVSASMIHLRGDPANTIEFSGAAGTQKPIDLVDNAACLETAHYITNRHQFNMPMPLWGTVIRSNWLCPTYGEPAFDIFDLFVRAYPYQAIEGALCEPRILFPGPRSDERLETFPFFYLRLARSRTPTNINSKETT